MAYSENTIPKISKTIVNGNIEFYQKTDKLFNTFKDILGVIQFNLLIEGNKTSPNVLKDLTDAYVSLDTNKLVLDDTVTEREELELENTPNSNSSGGSTLGGEFAPIPPVRISNNLAIDYIEDFKNLQDSLKLYILKKTGEGSIYENISEDIGLTLDQGSKVTFFNTRMDDYYYETSKEGAPTNIPANLINKVSQNTFKVTQSLNLKTDGILRSSLKNLSEFGLKPDTDYFNKVFEQCKQMKTTKLVTNFGVELGNIITFYKTLCIREQDETKSQYTQFLSTVEDLEQYLDIFNNNINATTTIS